MAGYGAAEQPAGGEAGGFVPGTRTSSTGNRSGEVLSGVEPSDASDPAEYPFEFATEYPGDADGFTHGPGDYSEPAAADGFGWLVHDEVPVDHDPLEDFGDEAAMVRPYAWTRGRTRANYDLKLETLISTTELGEDETLLPQLEHRAVSALCHYPLSVAEIGAKLSIPLGVTRVILSDMAELGLISIHRTFADDDIAAHLVLMERVLSGLRRL